MAFILSEKSTYPWTVSVQTPDLQKPGRWKTHTFTATFKKLPPLEVQERLTALSDKDLGYEERYSLENDFIEDVLLGWDGITDECGEPILFSAATRERVLDVPEVRRALFEAYFDSALHRKAATKN